MLYRRETNGGPRDARTRGVSVRAQTAVRAGLLLAFALLVLRPVCRERPQAHGDSGEYFLTAESWMNHASPLLHGEDVVSLGQQAREHRLRGTFGRLLGAYLGAPDGTVLGIHSWVYSLAALPAKAVLRLLGQNEFKAPQITNGLFLLGGLSHILFLSRFTPLARGILGTSFLFSPALPFVLWPHPEIFTYALVASALVFRHDGRPVAAILCAALASAQNGPLLLLALALWSEDVFHAGWRRRACDSLALLPAFAPPLLAFWSFGVPSLLITVGAASASNLSVGRAWELIADLNIGLLPFVPVTLAVGAVSLVFRPSRILFGNVLLIAALALAASVATNWNHGTVGPSRYTLWLLPLLLDGVARLAEQRSPRWRAAALLAASVQAGTALERGGAHVPPDHLRLSTAALVVLARWPTLYNPTPEIFAERVMHAERPWTAPVVLRLEGRCRKALAQKRHLPDLWSRCGEPASRLDLDRRIAREGRNAWGYVNY